MRQRYTLLARPDSHDELLDQLDERFERREQAETDRVAQVLALVTHDGCQVRELAAYFGEERAEPCGHCTHCLTGHPQQLPDPEPQPELEAQVDRAAVEALRAANPEALGSPRQLARFLCGITSPATTKAKLTREPLFGALAAHRFLDVLPWCEQL